MADLNPQAKQMADESMIRNLDAQARAIWPQEMPLFKRHQLPSEPQILDAGCGTGELASLLAELFPNATVLGVDIIDEPDDCQYSGSSWLRGLDGTSSKRASANILTRRCRLNHRTFISFSQTH
jgi:hypothetical protein